MSHFGPSPFAVTSVSYKNCLIVLESPRQESGGWCCRGRIVLGGRMNVPLAPARAHSSDAASEAALSSARQTIDSLQREA